MTISLVQHSSAVTKFTSGTSGTISPAFGVNVTAGNCIIAAFSVNWDATFISPSVSSVTTNGSAENWASAVSITGATADEIAAIWADPGSAGGNTVIDVNVAFGGTASSVRAVVVMADIYEVSGLASSSPVDKTSSHETTSGATWTSGTTAATTNAAEFWCGVGTLQGAASASFTGPGAPWTNETKLNSLIDGTNNAFQLSGFQITSSTGTATYSGTQTTNDLVCACVATFKAGVSGPAFFQAVTEVRARILQVFSKGRTYFSTRSPVSNPSSGPVFRQAVQPARPRNPQQGIPLKGRAYSNSGAPLRNPSTGPVFRQAVKPIRAVIPQTWSKGRVEGNDQGAPVRNPSSGPVFRQATSPVMARQPLPMKGRIAFHEGVAVTAPSSGPAFYPFRQAVHVRYPIPPRAGRVYSNPGAPVVFVPPPPSSSRTDSIVPRWMAGVFSDG